MTRAADPISAPPTAPAEPRPPLDFARRRRESEWMDSPDVDARLLDGGLRFIRRINAWLGYTRATIAHLERFSRRWKPGETIRLIDLATGSADVPLAAARWGRRRGFDVRVTGVDLHERTCAVARHETRREPRVNIVRADVLDRRTFPFDAGSFDYALSSMFLHHLDDEQIVSLLRAMDRLARRGVLAADLIRTRRAYAWISLFTLVSNPLLRHDARVSVAQALSEPEAQALPRRAGLDYLCYSRHFGHRFVLAGEKR
jgi:SAM-dependent methyltransferase